MATYNESFIGAEHIQALQAPIHRVGGNPDEI
jgi:hypothetical protein